MLNFYLLYQKLAFTFAFKTCVVTKYLLVSMGGQVTGFLSGMTKSLLCSNSDTDSDIENGV